MHEFEAKIGEATAGCPIALLDFDYENPRLTTGDNLVSHDEKSMICSLRDIAALNELIQSICKNGYLNLEPLIVIAKTDGRLAVLEGNRRLAAIKLIRNRDLARECRVPVPDPIPQKALDTTESISVWRVNEKADAQAFIGFKHINGPYRWDAYAKARFVADWYKRERKNGLTIESIAEQLGDDNDTIRAYIGAILVLEQAENEGLFGIKDRYNRGRFAFSHLYTALGRKEYQEFLGLAKGWNHTPMEEPIDSDKSDQLREVLSYCYGSKLNNQPSLIKSQNPDLKNLGEVLVHPVAIQMIRGGSDLKTAHNETQEAGAVFSEALVQARLKIESAIKLLAKYDGSPALLLVAEELNENTETLVQTMQRKHDKSLNK